LPTRPRLLLVFPALPPLVQRATCLIQDVPVFFTLYQVSSSLALFYRSGDHQPVSTSPLIDYLSTQDTRGRDLFPANVMRSSPLCSCLPRAPLSPSVGFSFSCEVTTPTWEVDGSNLSARYRCDPLPCVSLFFVLLLPFFLIRLFCSGHPEPRLSLSFPHVEVVFFLTTALASSFLPSISLVPFFPSRNRIEAASVVFRYSLSSSPLGLVSSFQESQK